MSYKRSVSVCDETASDLAGEIVAALSAASIVFKEENEYSLGLIKQQRSYMRLQKRKIRFTELKLTPLLMLVEVKQESFITHLGTKMSWFGEELGFSLLLGTTLILTMPPQTLLQQLIMKQYLTKGFSTGIIRLLPMR